LVAVVTACDDDKTPASTSGAGGAPAKDSGADTGTPSPGGRGGGGSGGSAGSPADSGPSDATTPPPGDGGLAPCLDLPTDLDRPPSGQLPCDLLPPGFVAP